MPLPIPWGGRLDAVIRLHDDVRGLTLQPVDFPAEIRLGRIEVVELGNIEATARLGFPWMADLVRNPARLPRALRTAPSILRTGGLHRLKARLAQNADARVGSGMHSRDYRNWANRYDRLADSDRSAIRARIERLTAPPAISILLPIGRAGAEHLAEAVESVRRQLYPHWEVWLLAPRARAESPDFPLTTAAISDPRIHVLTSGRTRSEILDAGLSAVHGAHFLMLNPEATLSEHALYWVSEVLTAHPEADLVYSDEDEIDGSGHRSNPFFKPDWSPSLLESIDLMGNLAVYRTSKVRELGGFSDDLENGHGYDLALRMAAETDGSRIRHIPAVLHHRRKASSSVSTTAEARILQDHFDRLGTRAEVRMGPHGERRIHHLLPSNLPLVSIIIPTRNGAPLLERCLDSVRTKTTYHPFELIVVDNQSDAPDTLACLAELTSRGETVLKYDAPFNFSAINNLAVRHAKGSVLALLNDDLEVITPEWLEEMASLALVPDVAAVGAKLYYPTGTIQHAGVVLGLGGIADHALKHLPGDEPGYRGFGHRVREYSAVTGACLVVRRSVFEAVGGFDERLRVAYNDVDLCLRFRAAGYRNVWTPHAELYHHESATRGPDDTLEKRSRMASEIDYMMSRWSSVIMDDPLFNPNLALNAPDFSLAWPPRVKKPWLADAAGGPHARSD